MAILKGEKDWISQEDLPNCYSETFEGELNSGKKNFQNLIEAFL